MAVALESQSACSIDAGDAGGKVVAPIWTFADEATRGGGDDDWATPTLTGFVFRSAMNLARHDSLKKKVKAKQGLFDTLSISLRLFSAKAVDLDLTTFSAFWQIYRLMQLLQICC